MSATRFKRLDVAGYFKKRREAAFERAAAGATLREIGDWLGVSKEGARLLVRKEARERGVEPPRQPQGGRRGVKRRPQIIIPRKLLEACSRGVLDVSAAAQEVGCCYATVILRLKEAGLTTPAQRVRANSATKYAEMYEKFMAGSTLRQLADEYHSTVGSVAGLLLRYRREHGLPGKYEVFDRKAVLAAARKSNGTNGQRVPA